MKGFAAFIVIIMALSLAMVIGLSSLADGATRQTNAQANLEHARGQAESMVIRAQAESRLTAAQASAITAAAGLPYMVLSVLGLLGLAIVALCIVIVTRPPRQNPPMIIERQIIYLPPPGAARRDVWQALSAGGDSEVLILPANRGANYDYHKPT